MTATEIQKLAPSLGSLCQSYGTTLRWIGLLAFLVLGGPYAVSLARSSGPFDCNGDLIGYDFFAFYYAGEMVNAGRLDALYDWTAQRNVQRTIVSAWEPTIQSYVCPYLNPPHYAWLMSWITPFGYAAALTLWWTLGLAAFLMALAIWQRWLSAETWPVAVGLTLGFPPFFQTFAGGQNTFLTVLILSGFCHLLLVRREWLAGLVLSLLAYKFQLIAVPALFLLMTARWRALIGMTIGLLATLALSLAYFGTDVLSAYLRFAGELPNLMQTSGFYAAKQHSWYGFFEMCGGKFWPIAIVRGVATLLSLATVCAMAIYVRRAQRTESNDADKSHKDLARSLSVMLIATVLASPHLFQYDLLILAPAAILWRAGESSAIRAWLRPTFRVVVAFTMLWLSFANRGIELLGIQLTPLLLAGWLIAIMLSTRNEPKPATLNP